MKYTFLLVTILAIVSCKDSKKETTNYSEEHLDVTTSIYPENISKVFEAHGGIDAWNEMNTLAFTMTKPDGDEVTTTDLKNRKALMEMPKHTIGFDGKDVWLHSKDETVYEGKPKFYYNLMFYFYAMPFVLSDDGIAYEDAAPLVFEGVEYPGIKISYEAGVGESPDDEYILYYDSKTHQMSWLAYTVTYFSKEKAKEFHFIKYSNWQEVGGLLMPETLSWYNYENNLPTTKKNDMHFIDVRLSKEKQKASFFEAPEEAKIVE
ncbi:DUF6503 family protein [Mariniflexile gromovii]|uniref:Threonine synthase n=1 Tax=Mariniflexile gromovii TaxID=362523 RepID=A0ABS4BZ30_9FLAO|nr:DUF6503 family protein [Mariniflexile gromovii]MBP0905842.1 hypothetical protein [Mariniflexile gromovii]